VDHLDGSRRGEGRAIGVERLHNGVAPGTPSQALAQKNVRVRGPWVGRPAYGALVPQSPCPRHQVLPERRPA
jgi:hypothetical protein